MNIRVAEVMWLALCIAICELAGIIGSIFTVSAIPSWYAGLAKPALNPPSWVFGPVWTILYALMGVALFLLIKRGRQHPKWKIALSLFGAQLLANALWSVLFFGAHSPFMALINIVILWILIVGTIICFYRISKPAAYLLAPYLIWVSFATYLNYMIFRLN